MNLGEARTLCQLLRGMPGGGDHSDRLEAFYGPQAADYDRFRERLLPGRAELLDWLKPAPGESIVELGAGTGRNPEFLGAGVAALGRLTLVDLCPSLLAKARQRWSLSPNVSVVEADACTWQPDGAVDAVYFSYALTMIPNWSAAIDNAIAMLRPGGRLGVVDFTITASQSWTERSFWRTWFKHDGVSLDAEHPATLGQRLPCHERREYRTAVPYLAGMSVPYYLFLGVKD